MSIFNPASIGNEIDNNLRPYTHGFKARNPSIATIVLYTGDSFLTTVPSEELSTIDYNSKDNRVSVQAIRPEVYSTVIRETSEQVEDQVPTLVNNASGLYLGIFNNFSLLEVGEAKDQVIKLHQNFGDSWNLFFFGDSPSIYTFKGVFLDTWEYPYYHEFMTMYDRYLMGRKCVQNGFKMKIVYDDKIIGGYLLNIQTVLSADTPHTKSFSFTVILTDEGYLRDNAEVVNGEFTGRSRFNYLNNTHRVVKQYPNLLPNPERQQ